MERKTFKNPKKMKQPELPCKPMVDAELPGMPEAPPKPPEPEISESLQFAISECAIGCAREPGALEIFLEELAEALYCAKRKPLSIIMISHDGSGISCNVTLLPEASGNEPLDPVHELALKCFGGQAGLSLKAKPEVIDDRRKGIYQKYLVYRLNDSNHKHKDCEYFVLDWKHDKYTIPALTAYAEACRDEYPELAADIFKKINYYSLKKCRVCGYTDDKACPGGCCWIEKDLCSRCNEFICDDCWWHGSRSELKNWDYCPLCGSDRIYATSLDESH